MNLIFFVGFLTIKVFLSLWQSSWKAQKVRNTSIFVKSHCRFSGKEGVFTKKNEGKAKELLY